MKKFDTFQTFARGAKSLVAILLVMLMAVSSLFAQTQQYSLVTENQTDWTGTYLITASPVSGNNSGTVQALSSIGTIGTGTTNVGIGTNVTSFVDGSVIASNATTDACAVIVAAGSDGTYTLRLNNEYLYWASGNSLESFEEAGGAAFNWNISFTNGTVAITNANDNNRNLQYNAGNPRFACYTSNQTAINLYKLGTSTPAVTVAAPTFTPAAGTYTAAQSVTLATTTEGAIIYYTVDGTEPTSESLIYQGAISVDEDMTIKAIAILGEDQSTVATANYVINLPLTVANIAAFKALELNAEATITGDVTVLGQHSNNLFVQDATGALVVYGSTGNNYNAGDVISGGIKGKRAVYNGMKQMSNPANFSAGVAGTPVEPIVVSAADLIANYDTYESKLVTIENVELTANHTFTASGADRGVDVTQGESTITVYDQFKVVTGVTVSAGAKTVTGYLAIYVNNNTTKYEIFPRGEEDIIDYEEEEPVVIEPTWVSCDQVGIFNTQVVGLVPTCETVGDSTVFHFSYTDAFNGYPTQNPNTSLGANASKVYVDIKVARPSDEITGIKYGDEILNFADIDGVQDFTLGAPYFADLTYVPVATVNGEVTEGNATDRNWTMTYEWCIGNEVVAIQKLNILVDAAPIPDLDVDSVATLPYTYNFDEGTDPYFMINNGENNTNAWYVGQAQGFDNNKLYISSNGGTTNKYDVTKASTVTAYRDVMIPETGAILSFDYRVNGQANYDYLQVSLEHGNEAAPIAQLSSKNEWTSFSYDISGEMAGEVRVKFTWINNASNGNQFPAAIDNISVIETPCSQPTNLAAAVDSTTTVVVTWEAAEGQTAWNFQYKLADHSEWYTVPTTATTVTLNDLQGNSNYNMRVQAVCGENVSAWTNGTFAVACQTEEVTVTPTDVVIGTGTSTTNYIFPGYYGWQYSAILYDMNQAGPINSIAFYLNSASSTSGSTMTVWVKAVSSDYALASSNTFATMVDGAQQIYDGAPDFSTAGWITFPVNNFTLAEGQDLLVLVRGVGCSTSGDCSKQARYTYTSNKLWYKLQDSSDPGQSVTGTMNSYRPNITINMDVTVVTCDDQIACVAPTGLQVSDVTANSAVLTWTAGAEGQNNFIVEYQAAGATEWTSIDVNDTTYTLTGLAQLTNYSVKVKANCGANNWSEVITASFRTVGICPPVTNLETSNVSNTTTLTWEPGGEESAWLVEFKPASESEDAWTSINVNMLPMTTFGGLVGNTDYNVRVKALCDPEDTENQSEWASATFHSGCAASDLPFTQEFDASSMPVCWENEGFGFNSLNGAFSNINGAELISPAINIPAENPTYLSFEVRGSGSYTVLASYRGTRADRFAEIYSGTAPNQNTTVTIALDDLYKGRAVNFKVVNNSTSYQYFYHLTVNQCPFEATALNVAAYTGTTVALAWEADEAAANFQVQYGEQGFTVGEGTTVDVTDTTAVTISELSYETAYDFYVRVVCEGDNGAWAGPVSATTAPACSDPMNLSFDFTAAQLHWNNGEWGTPAQYNVRYKVEGAEEYTTDVVTPVAMPGYTPFYTISGLQSNTTYEMGVQSVCGENMESNWVTLMVTTPCMPLTEIPYTQDFEGDVFPPECWSQQIIEGSEEWEQYTGQAYFTYDPDNKAMLITPSFDLSSSPSLILSFKHQQEAFYGSQDELRVYYRTSMNSNWVLMQAYTENITSMTQEEIAIPAEAMSSSCQFAFEATANDGYGIYVDDVTIKPAPTCGTPFISVNGLIATITPNEPGTPAGYELMIGEEIQIVTSTTVDLHTVFPSLELNTAYQISVRTICTGNETSEWYGPVAFTTPQCWESCTYVVNMEDSYGDGWNGNAIYVKVDGELQQTVTLTSGTSAGIANVLVCSGAVSFVWHSGGDYSYPDEVSFVIKNETGTPVYTCEDGSALTDGQTVYTTYCGTYPACGTPSISVDNMIATITPSEFATTTPHSYELMVGNESHVVTTTTVDLSTIFTTLESSSTYEITVRAYCGESDTSGWSAPVEFVTPCLAMSLPYEEDFNSYSTSATSSSAPTGYPNHTMPLCWNFLNMSTSTSSYPQMFLSSYSSYAVSGNCLFFKSSKDNPAYAVLPKLTEDIQNMVISFTYRNEGTGTSNGTLYLGYMTNPTDPSTFVSVYTCTQTTTKTAVEYAFNQTSVTGSNYYIAFRYTGGSYNNYYAAIDNVMVTELPSCPKPTAITVGTVTETTAQVSWTAGSSESEWEVSYTLGEQTITETTTNNPYTITGLSASTHYVMPFSVKAICSETDESDVVSKDLSFNTACAPVAVPYSENFDSYTSTTTQSSMVMPVCWTSKYTGTSTYYGAGIYSSSSYAVSGNNSLRLYTYYSTSTATTYGDAYAVMPEMEANLNTLMISFDAKKYSATTTYGSHFEVGAVTDAENPQDSFETIEAFTSIQEHGGRITVLLSNYEGSGKHIAFRATKDRPAGTTYTSNYVFIDNILVESIPTCFTPTDLTVSGVTDHTAEVSWTDNYDQSSYALEYRADNENGWHTVNVDTTYYLLNNLLASTEYHVRVKAVCGPDDETEYTETVTFTTICEHGLETTIAGTGGTTYYLPVDNFYHYSYTQQIIDAAEMGGTGVIGSISFEYNYSSPMTKKNNVKIYMGHTDKTVFASTTDWVTSGLQEVYSGALNCSQGWNDFALTTPFMYNGGNVVVVIEDMSDDYDGNSYTFKQTTTSGYKGMYYHDDNNPFTGSNTASGRTTYRSNMKLIGCPDPYDVAVVAVNAIPDACEVEGAVTIEIKNNGYEPVNAFTVSYQLNDATPVQENVTLAAPLAMGESTIYTFTQLPTFVEGSYTITASVAMEGDAVDANNTITSAPITVLAPIAVPYEEAFTGLTINHGWNPIDANNDGITMNLNNNINYTFNDEAAADDWMMSPCIEMAAGTYTIIYDYKANSSLTESFAVFYGNGAHIADMTNAVAAHTFNNTTVETATTTITIPADGIYNFGFHATSLAGNLGFSIDNFKVYPVNNVLVTFDTNGTVTPNGNIAVNYGENLTLNIVPKPMYHVAGVWVDDVQVVPEDGTGANFMLYTLENVTEPHTVFVDFKLEFHIFKTVENYRSDLYSDLGGAFVPAATDTTIDPNAFTVNMVADPHYHLAGLTLSPVVPDNPEDVFADVVNNGDGTYNYTIDTLVVANYYLNATFRRDTVAIKYNVLTGKGYANDSELLNAGETYTTWVDYSVYNDVDTTVSFAGTDTYHIVDVIVNGTSKGRIDSYTFENVTETQNVDLKFGYKIDASVVNNNTYGDIDIMDPQGTIEPATQYVPEYDAMTVTGTVAEHFHLYQLLVNGEDRIDEVVFGADFSTYSFTMDSVANNYTIVAVVKVDTFAITYNVLAGQGYADASDLMVAGDTYSTIVNYADNWYSDIVPATGYSIDNVTLDGQNLYTANNYQFNYIEGAHVFDIVFVANTYTVTTNAYGDGTVSEGISFTYDPETPVDYEFTATAAEGHHIVSVVINNEEMEITDPETFTYTIENVADNYVINAYFAVNTYTMTAEATEGGTITPEGTQIVNYGTDLTYEINANEGWYISSTEIDGVTTTYTQEDATVTLSVPYTSIDADHSVSVTFAQFMYTITANASEYGTVNGAATISETVVYGSNFSLNITPDANYQVADVVVDGLSVGAVEFYEFINVTANHTVDVTFEAIMYTLTATSNIEGCTITPATLTVQAGSNVPYTLNAAAGYHLVNVMANGEEVAVTNNSFTIIDVQSDYTIFANFAPDYVTVTVDQPAHATITPGTQTYAYGATPSYMIIPEVGYDIVSVTAGNGVVNVDYNNGIGTFTLDPVLADITLTATTQPKTFTITVVQGINGTIAPATQTGVEYGSSVEFTITPDEFYVISDVIVDGSSRGAISGFTFNNVTNDHTITAVFEAACYMPTNLTAMNITSTSADLSWVGTAPSYEVRYRAAGETTYHTQTVNTTTLSLSGLTPNTLYSWGVKAVCGSSLESEWAENGFTTRNGVGIADADMTSIKVYSFQNNVYIVNEDGIAISNVDIYDIYGKQVYTGKVLSSPEVISLNVAEGNYVVRLATENGVGVYKVAIVK